MKQNSFLVPIKHVFKFSQIQPGVIGFIHTWTHAQQTFMSNKWTLGITVIGKSPFGAQHDLRNWAVTPDSSLRKCEALVSREPCVLYRHLKCIAYISTVYFLEIYSLFCFYRLPLRDGGNSFLCLSYFVVHRQHYKHKCSFGCCHQTLLHFNIYLLLLIRVSATQWSFL